MTTNYGERPGITVLGFCACGKHDLTAACVPLVSDHDGITTTHHFAHQCSEITWSGTGGNATRKAHRVIARNLRTAIGRAAAAREGR